MADRIYLGKLATIHSSAFPESADSYEDGHSEAGFSPHEILKETLIKGKTTVDNETVVWAHYESVWVRITPAGDIEIGEAGV